MKLWYDKPAANWREALPIGNGRLGAMLSGGLAADRWQLNEETLWSGGPHHYERPNAHRHLEDVRQAIFQGRNEQAEELFQRHMRGEPAPLQTYLPFCDVGFDYPGHSHAEHYRRELDLERSVSTVSYSVDGVDYKREVFCSYPDQAIVMRMTASRSATLNVIVSLHSLYEQSTVASEGGDTLVLRGSVGPRPGARRKWVAGWEGTGLRYEARLRVDSENGSVRATEEGGLDIRGADAVTVYFTGATSFLDYRDDGGDPAVRATELMKHASGRSYQELLQRHIEDYTSLYKRVELVLDHDPDEDQKSTDVRIAASEQLQDPGLSALYFQYGRYLLISSSRPGGQPANLQGIWNEEKEPLWGSKWTTNINVQMNYWPAESTNLAECHLPLFDLIEDLRESGARAAKAHYNAEGFVVHHNTDLWRAAAPADADAGVWPMGAAWLVQHLWDHYEYAPDRTFLETKVYPAMLDAARFILDYLTEAPADTAEAGKWVTCPSYSPENAYITEDGRSGYLTYAATLDLQLIADLFQRCILASEIMEGDESLRARMQEALSRMPEMRIGRYGQLQEWIGDWDRPDDANSHVSHLYGLYPGHQISLERTPAWAEGVRTSLQMRGEGRGGWGAAWRIALHAHLRDAAAAHNQLIQLISRSATPNLLNMRPPLPMQIDGNLGGTAGIAEMLLQSRVHYSGQVPEYGIELLPALPSQWPNGSYKGLRARGGFELAAAWRDGRLSKAELSAKRSGICTVRYQDRTMRMEVEADHTYELAGLCL